MHQVVILCFHQALGSAITGMLDLFKLAGVTWERIHGLAPRARFAVELASIDGAACRCINGLSLPVHRSLAEVQDPDLVIVPTIGGPIEATLGNNRAVIDWLARRDLSRTVVAGNCTGTFLLAEAGLLDGRLATTHWGYSAQFAERYGQVDLQAERLITVDGAVLCAGGGVAWLDLGIYLVERFCGGEVARELAKAYVIDLGRHSQSAYSSLPARRYHQDQTVLAIQDWLDGQYATPIDIAALAAQFGLSHRSLIRRFVQATGETPLVYLQRLRVEAAKRALEGSLSTLEDITLAVGYEDASSFSRLFRRFTGMTPSGYRSRFGR